MHSDLYTNIYAINDVPITSLRNFLMKDIYITVTSLLDTNTCHD